MPFPGRWAGHGLRRQWPLAAAWAVAVASLLADALLPRAARHAYGMFLLVGSTGSLVAVVGYARLLGRGMRRPRTVLLVGGPWEGPMQLTLTGPMPEDVWLARPVQAPACHYRHQADDRDRPQLAGAALRAWGQP